MKNKPNYELFALKYPKLSTTEKCLVLVQELEKYYGLTNCYDKSTITRRLTDVLPYTELSELGSNDPSIVKLITLLIKGVKKARSDSCLLESLIPNLVEGNLFLINASGDDGNTLLRSSAESKQHALIKKLLIILERTNQLIDWQVNDFTGIIQELIQYVPHSKFDPNGNRKIVCNKLVQLHRSQTNRDNCDELALLCYTNLATLIKKRVNTQSSLLLSNESQITKLIEDVIKPLSLENDVNRLIDSDIISTLMRFMSSTRCRIFHHSEMIMKLMETFSAFANTPSNEGSTILDVANRLALTDNNEDLKWHFEQIAEVAKKCTEKIEVQISSCTPPKPLKIDLTHEAELDACSYRKRKLEENNIPEKPIKKANSKEEMQNPEPEFELVENTDRWESAQFEELFEEWIIY